jgi:DNA invertase Pin-like site-specific DNA recombinase
VEEMSKGVAIYIRVSTFDKQESGVRSQEEILREYCYNHNMDSIRVYIDRITGSTIDRPQLKILQEDIFMGRVSTVVVWKLDRLSRSLKDGINILTDWLEKDIRIISITEQFDFSGVTGKLVASVLFGVAEMERQNIRENIKRGMLAAKKRGVKIGGRKPKIFLADIMKLKRKGLGVTQIAKKMKCSRQAIYLVLRKEKVIV